MIIQRNEACILLYLSRFDAIGEISAVIQTAKLANMNVVFKNQHNEPLVDHFISCLRVPE